MTERSGKQLGVQWVSEMQGQLYGIWLTAGFLFNPVDKGLRMISKAKQPYGKVPWVLGLEGISSWIICLGRDILRATEQGRWEQALEKSTGFQSLWQPAPLAMTFSHSTWGRTEGMGCSPNRKGWDLRQWKVHRERKLSLSSAASWASLCRAFVGVSNGIFVCSFVCLFRD